MKAEGIAAAAFSEGTAWGAADFEAARTDPARILVERDGAFALARVTLDEAELLLIATHPDARRTGAATKVLRALEARCHQAGATRLFLEVAADNTPARALYTAAGYRQSGRRTGYYRRADGVVDAVLMDKRL
ncbi:MAG: GNAT family N-acetyltransferase [Shimia sp.]